MQNIAGMIPVCQHHTLLRDNTSTGIHLGTMLSLPWYWSRPIPAPIPIAILASVHRHPTSSVNKPIIMYIEPDLVNFLTTQSSKSCCYNPKDSHMITGTLIYNRLRLNILSSNFCFAYLQKESKLRAMMLCQLWGIFIYFFIWQIHTNISSTWVHTI